jgi:23S rRNA pseudouridine2605 synthase
MRINRFLAASGLGSRRSCEELILAGNVTINGKVCQNLATDVTEEDFVKVGSRRIVPEKHLYVLLHKPRGYLCTAADTHDRKTIFELLPAQWPRMFHVGRLDRDSEGLLIMTNDGDLGLHLTHPRYKIEKEYEVLLDRPYDGAVDTPKLLKGVSIEGGRARAESVRQVSPMLLRVVLKQGLKRQIRHMFYKVGYEVERLIRIRIGPLRLTELHAGEWRALTAVEVKGLRDIKPEPEREKVKRPSKPKSHAGEKRERPVAAGNRGPRAGAREAKRLGIRPAAESKGRGKPGRKFSGRGSASSTPRAGRRP